MNKKKGKRYWYMSYNPSNKPHIVYHKQYPPNEVY
jgi:hypothetical protein